VPSAQIHLRVVLPEIVHKGDYGLRSPHPVRAGRLQGDAVQRHADLLPQHFD